MVSVRPLMAPPVTLNVTWVSVKLISTVK